MYIYPSADPCNGNNKLAKVPQAVDEIRNLLGQDAVSTDHEVLLVHGYSSWSTSNVDSLPVAVVYPHSTQQTAEIVKICHKYRVPMSKLPPRS